MFWVLSPVELKLEQDLKGHEEPVNRNITHVLNVFLASLAGLRCEILPASEVVLVCI